MVDGQTESFQQNRMNRPHTNFTPVPARSSFSARRGFTAIEMMVVVGIIVLLAGLLTAGMRAYMTSAQTESTRSVLETARTLFDEVNRDPVLRTRMNTALLPSFFVDLDSGSRTLDNAGIRDAYAWTDNRFPNSSPTSRYDLAENDFAYIEAPVFVDSERADSASPDAHRFTAPAIIYTHRLMTSLANRPSTRRLVDTLPSERKLFELPASWRDGNRNPLGFNTSQPSDTSRPARIDPPLLLDAWGNPLIFVPDDFVGIRTSPSGTSTGRVEKTGFIGRNWDAVRLGTPNSADTYFPEGTIAFTTSGSGANRTVTVARATRSHRKADVPFGDADYWQMIEPIRSPDRRPFWISAGPDGNFATADDNLYSFDN